MVVLIVDLGEGVKRNGIYWTWGERRPTWSSH